MTHQKVQQSQENHGNKQINSSKQTTNTQHNSPSIIQDILNLYISRD